MPKENSPVKPAVNNKEVEYNPRWLGYSYILLTSLINLSAICNIQDKTGANYDGNWSAQVVFGAVTFVTSLLVLVQDRTQLYVEMFHFMHACKHRLEGTVLLLFCIWWIVGVAYMTQVGGVAYLTNNVYFSSWAALAACGYTLNEWSAAHDILSVAELTGVSATLKSWYVCFLSSLVMTGSTMDLFFVLAGDNDRSNAALGIALGGTSTLLCLGWILTHYNLLEWCNEGGWVEFSTSICLILLWIVNTAVLTQDGGIASTFSGSGCADRFLGGSADLNHNINFHTAGNCTVSVNDGRNSSDVKVLSCEEIVQREIPGSNIYLATWIAMFASCYIPLRWKAQQALQFAKAQHQKAAAMVNNDNAAVAVSDSKHDDDDDLEHELGSDADDLESYEDARY